MHSIFYIMYCNIGSSIAYSANDGRDKRDSG